eukprot:3938854-Rhodomonas_salina.1
MKTRFQSPVDSTSGIANLKRSKLSPQTADKTAINGETNLTRTFSLAVERTEAQDLDIVRKDERAGVGNTRICLGTPISADLARVRRSHDVGGIPQRRAAGAEEFGQAQQDRYSTGTKEKSRNCRVEKLKTAWFGSSAQCFTG